MTRPRPPLPDGVKPTGGGTFDPNSDRLYFVAGNVDKIAATHDGQPVLIAVNELERDQDFDTVKRLSDTRPVLLDSGIFNLAMGHARAHDMHMDQALRLPPDEVDGFVELRDRYYKVVTSLLDHLWGFIELDQGGREVKPHTRAQIEADLGVSPIPVYHPLLDGWDYYDTLATGYDRICFGNLVKAPPPTRLRLVHTAAERARNYPHLWTHLLGVYPNENLLALSMRGSFDSSSWLTSLRWMPSWKGWTMLKMLGHFPPDVWYIDSDDPKANYTLAQRMNEATAHFTQTTLDATRKDTHPWP